MIARLFRVLVMGALLAGLCGSVRAAHQSGLIATTQWRRMELTVTMAQRVYPLGALALVHVRLTNVSRRVIRASFVCAPGDDMDVQVFSDAGRTVYPPAAPELPPPTPICLSIAIINMRPGQSVRADRYVILRARNIRVTFPFGGGPNFVRGYLQAWAIVGLTTGVPPSVTLSPAPKLSARVGPVRGPHGPLVFTYGETCGPGKPDYTAQTWTVSPTPVIKPICPDPLGWQLVVGWLDQPVAYVNYGTQPETGR